jgi:hypothetical protein
LQSPEKCVSDLSNQSRVRLVQALGVAAHAVPSPTGA